MDLHCKHDLDDNWKIIYLNVLNCPKKKRIAIRTIASIRQISQKKLRLELRLEFL